MKAFERNTRAASQRPVDAPEIGDRASYRAGYQEALTDAWVERQRRRYENAGLAFAVLAAAPGGLLLWW